MRTKERILLEAKAWREEKIALDADYFTRLNDMHRPKILWISSSDSLASIREITNTEPGDIIIYGNLGAQVKHDDESLMALIAEAVESFDISQIILCGYSHCMGVRHMIRQTPLSGEAQQWLSGLRALYDKHASELRELPLERQEKRLSELNIREQVMSLSRVPCIQKAWEKRDYPEIYGWYFDLATGSLQEVFSLERNHRIKQVSSLTDPAEGIKITAS